MLERTTLSHERGWCSPTAMEKTMLGPAVWRQQPLLLTGIRRICPTAKEWRWQEALEGAQ